MYQLNIADIPATESIAGVEIIKISNGLIPNELQFDQNATYKTLKSRDTEFHYGLLNKVHPESVDESANNCHVEIISDVLNQQLERKSAVLDDRKS